MQTMQQPVISGGYRTSTGSANSAFAGMALCGHSEPTHTG